MQTYLYYNLYFQQIKISQNKLIDYLEIVKYCSPK